MSRFSEKKIIILCALLFMIAYIAVHTDAIGNFISVISPFVNGFILAYLTDILASAVEAKIPFKSARGVSIVIVYLLFAGILAVLLVYLVPILSQNIQILIRMLPVYLERYNVGQIADFIGDFSLSDIIPRLSEQIMGVTVYAKAATSGIVNIVLSFVVSIYVLITKKSILRFAQKSIGLTLPKHAKTIKRLTYKSHQVFQQFLVAQLFACLILGVISGIVLSILGVNYALLIGTIIGLSNVIPLFGAIIGVVVATVLMFITNPPLLSIASFVFLLLMQQIDATVITPKLMGNALNLSPIVVILVLLVGTTYFGIIGILFAVPITVMIREIVKEKIR